MYVEKKRRVVYLVTFRLQTSQDFLVKDQPVAWNKCLNYIVNKIEGFPRMGKEIGLWPVGS